MMYVLVPHVSEVWEHVRFFSTYASVEAVALRTARAIEAQGGDPDWCIVVGLDGIEELTPHFLFTLVGSARLHREPWPTPSP